MREKLIRDKIPDLARADGRDLKLRTVRADEWDRLLGQKLVEEVHEVLSALENGVRDGLVDELADLLTVIEALANRKGIQPEEITQHVQNKLKARGGFKVGWVLQEHEVKTGRLHTGGANSLIDAFRHELQASVSVRIAVSFILSSGLDLLEGPIRAALLRGAEIKLLTTDYLNVTEPDALERISGWSGRFQARIYSHERRSFHPKAYLFERADGSGRAFIGSANVSRMGLRDGVEWTWTVIDADAGQPLHEIRTRFDELFSSEEACVLTRGWIDAYRTRRQVHPFSDPLIQRGSAIPLIEPREVQVLALQELDRLRSDGQTRALIVAATGLGKTFLAAFDARDAERVLFIAHREELLRQAEAAFTQLYPDRTRGFVSEGRLEYDRECVFASVQTISRPEQLTRAELSRFDYVIIDEFHHAAADSYRRVLDVISPRFLLGLTATPFRGDNRDLLSICDNNLAYQIGLFEAIGFGWLVPFHYFGIADTVTYTDDLLTSRKTYDARKLTVRFNTSDRARLVIERFGVHDSRAALGFCVSIEHADFMADQFNSAGIPAAAVHSGRSSTERGAALNQLAAGTLRIIFTVDLFNEGVDIPIVDLVIFLRPTESMTVFLQQLGRGLRLLPGKKFLTVMDLIGSYRNVHFKLPFLAGQDLTQNCDPARALNAILRWQREGAIPEGVPAGVRIEFEPVALTALRAALQSASPLRQLVIADLKALAEELGRPPTLLEWQQLGRYSLGTARTALGVDRWHQVLETAGWLTLEANKLESEAGDFLREVEISSMTRSFKMVVLLAMWGSMEFRTSVSIYEVIRYFRTYFGEDRHRIDIMRSVVEDVETVTVAKWRTYLLENPVRAWVGGNTGRSSPFFEWREETEEFCYIGPRPTNEDVQRRFVEAVCDRANARLFSYWGRLGPNRLVFSVIPAGQRGLAEGYVKGDRKLCIMFGNQREALPEGWHTVMINQRHLYGKFFKDALNVLKEQPSDEREVPNCLTSELVALFGGKLPLRPRVRFVKAPASDVWQIYPV